MFDGQSYFHYLNIQKIIFFKLEIIKIQHMIYIRKILSKQIEIYNIMMLAPKFAENES